MEYVIMIAIGIAAFILGAYCFNGFVVPLFYTLPRMRSEKKSGNLSKPMPVAKLILGPLASVTIFPAIMYFSYSYYVAYPWSVFTGFAIALIGVYSKMKSNKGEKEVEFLENYGDFLKKQ